MYELMQCQECGFKVDSAEETDFATTKALGERICTRCGSSECVVVKLEFAVAMARHTRATVRQIEALMRYAGTLQRIAESECNDDLSDVELAKREAKKGRIQQRVREVCSCLSPNPHNPESFLHPVFSTVLRASLALPLVVLRHPRGSPEKTGCRMGFQTVVTGKRLGCRHDR